MSDYNFLEIEERWQKAWAGRGTYEVDRDPGRKKFYCLEMLPYPSGDIHVGHTRNYCIGDVIARFKRMNGYNVMHPIGWDALGLPAENAAIQRGVHPEKWTRGNITSMRRQLKRLGFSYPWDREIATCDPEYYRWNQWFFLRMLERGIAYRKKAAVNWCPSCKTVLANEQAEGGVCWRCGSTVEERELDQWFLRITDYQDALIDDMAQLGPWPERVLVQQRNWIGRSPGAEVDFAVEGGEPIRVFTTRIDTIYGATFLVLAPEHPRVEELIGNGGDPTTREGIARLRSQDRRARQAGQIEKEGVFTGRYAVNPFTKERIPIWVSNFVLMGYGTGAIMAVPAHDQRDLEFARKYDLPVRAVIQPGGEALDGDTMNAPYEGAGRTVDCGPFSGLDSREAAQTMTAHAEATGFGKAAVTYRLRDWLISRQRYWGTPIPVVYCDQDGLVPVPDFDLPVMLPAQAPFTGEGGNPLEKVPEFVNTTCPRCGGAARRETDTMDTFVDSSWYFYRYLSPHDDKQAVAAEQVRYWFPIDLYIGGTEHAILHLVYSRFWTKVMRDLGIVGFDEPVTRLFPQGMVHRNGEVMSKSKGNTVAPDEVIAKYGADTLRLYILFAAPPEMSLEWSESGIAGPHRFLQRVYRLLDRHAAALARQQGDPTTATGDAAVLRKRVHQAIQRVAADIDERIHLNTAVAALMELLNEIEAAVSKLGEDPPSKAVLREALETLLLLLSPFTPHVCEELWARLNPEKGSIVDAAWPVADPAVAREEAVELAVQVNGKVRARITVPAGAGEEAVRAQALAEPRVREHMDGKRVSKVVVVPGRLVNVVVQ